MDLDHSEIMLHSIISFDTNESSPLSKIGTHLLFRW